MQSTRFAYRIAMAIAAVAVSVGGAAQTDEQAFIKDAVQGNLAEVHFGELATQRAESPEVRKFAETLRQDHYAMLQRARAVAKSLQVEPPTEAPTAAEGAYEGLAQLSGAQFDAAFLSHMVTAHEAEIAKYARNTSSDNDAVAALVADALPKLRTHLSQAQALQRGSTTEASVQH